MSRIEYLAMIAVFLTIALILPTFSVKADESTWSSRSGYIEGKSENQNMQLTVGETGELKFTAHFGTYLKSIGYSLDVYYGDYSESTKYDKIGSAYGLVKGPQGGEVDFTIYIDTDRGNYHNSDLNLLNDATSGKHYVIWKVWDPYTKDGYTAEPGKYTVVMKTTGISENEVIFSFYLTGNTSAVTPTEMPSITATPTQTVTQIPTLTPIPTSMPIVTDLPVITPTTVPVVTSPENNGKISIENRIDDNTAEYNGHYYRVIKESRVSWDQAKQKCMEMGGHLVTITSQDEQSFIERLNSSNTRLWIGGYRDSSYKWYWVTDEQWNYSNWGSGEPSGGNEDKAAVWPQKWNDMISGNLGEQNGFICEWDDYKSFENSSYDSSNNPGSKKDYNGHSYQIVIQDDISWSEAKQKCINMGGHLVTITSQGEQSFIESINSDNERLWIGGYKDSSNWYWVTDEQWNYSNWGSGEPSGGSEDKAAVWPQKWNDMTDDNRWEQNGFICEWDNGKNLITATPTLTQTVTPVPTAVPTATPKPTQTPVNKNTKISSKKVTIYVGSIAQLELTNASGEVKWSSSKKSVVTVKNGIVAGIKKGKATITATDSATGKTYKCKITVKNTSISKKTASIMVGESLKLKVAGTDVVKWTSSDKKVATVSNGTVKGVGKGKATITAVGENGVRHKCTVTVKAAQTDKSNTSIKKNFQKVVNYIKKHGSLTSDKKEYILMDSYFGLNSDDVYTVWTYNTAEDVVNFGLYYPSGSLYQFSYSLDDLSICTYTIYFTYENGQIGLYDKGQYTVKKYNNNLKMDTLQVFSDDGQNITSGAGNYINEYKEGIIQLYSKMGYFTENLLLNELNLTLKDLGYEKWIVD